MPQQRQDGREPQPMPAPDVLHLLHLRTSRRSVSREPVAGEILLALLEAARLAPSWGNRQPCRFILVQGEAAHAGVAAALTPGNAWAQPAPAYIVVAADPADGKVRGEAPYYLFDAGLAVECLILEAARRGLVAHPIAGWDHDLVHQAIAAPPAVQIVVVIVVAWPGDTSALDEKSRERELRARERKPLAEVAYADQWGQPLLPSHVLQGDQDKQAQS
jgi:nitroreductase